MGAGQIVMGCLTGLIGIGTGIYVSFTVRGKGPILSNTYLLLRKEQRKKADAAAEYRFISVVFGCLTIVLALLSLYIFTFWVWAYLCMWAVAVFTVLYVVAQAVKTERNTRKK